MKASVQILFLLFFYCCSFAQKKNKQLNRGIELIEKQQYQSALKSLYNACGLFENDTLNINYSKNLIYIGECYFHLDIIDSASYFYERGLKISETNSSSLDHKILDHIGTSFYKKKKYNDALEIYLKEYDFISKTFGQNSKSSIIATSNIASSYYKLKNFQKAKEYYLVTLENKEFFYGKNSKEYSLTLAWLIDLYISTNDFQNAKEKSLAILEIRKATTGLKTVSYKNNLYTLAVIYEKLLDFKNAHNSYDELVNSEKLNVKEEDDIYFKSYLALVRICIKTGDFNKAKSSLLRLEEYSPLKSNPTFYSEFLNLKLLYNLETHNYIKAYEINQGIIENYLGDSTKNKLLADHYNINGELFRRSYLKEDAKLWYKRAMLQAKTFGDTANSSYAAILNNLALLYTNTDTATVYLMLSYNVLNSIKEKVPEHYSSSVLNLAINAYYYQKDTSLAYSLVEKLLLEYKKHLSSENLRRLFFLTTEVMLDFGIDSIAASSLNVYINLKKKQLTEIGTLSSNQLNQLFESDYLEDPRSLGNLIMKLNKRDTISVKKYNLIISYFNLINLRKSLLLKINITKNNYIKKVEEEGASNLFLSLLEKRDKLIDLEMINVTQNLTGIENLKSEIDSLENLLLLRSRFYADLKNTLDIKFELISRSLGKNSASIFVFNEGEDYFSFVVGPHFSEPILIHLFTKEKLMALTKKELNESDSGYYNKIYTNTNFSRKLKAMIWAPIENFLSDIQTIYLTTSGILNLINLPSLPLDNKVRLGDKYLFKYIGSPGEIIHQSNSNIQDAQLQKAWLFGGINYNKMSSVNLSSKLKNEYDSSLVLSNNTRSGAMKWSYLRNTFYETSFIDTLCQKNNILSKFFSGEFATKTSFKNITSESKPYFIHVATHGYFFEESTGPINESVGDQYFKYDLIRYSENPLIRSGLIFSGANKTWSSTQNQEMVGDDGILTALEVSNLNLSNAQLVVLSACETGLGELKGSEGVFGLQRSFKIAGVKNLIVSLWKLPDFQTTEFMKLFYSLWLVHKHPLRDAFRKTQNLMSKKYSPYNWAAFILIE
jgi:CHAT domain-containing protein/tetratricopeptide (TPR) repeat protein